jgi:DNA-binding GntR family transcriptional regulator
MGIPAMIHEVTNPLIKDNIAAQIRHEIVAGTLAPGEALVEGKWAVKLGVAQASIRAALHILEAEGFVERGSGRSARVTQITGDDIQHNVEVRIALESLAARLVTARGAELGDLDQIVADMRSAVACRNLQAFYERDLRFHLTLCEKAGNPVLTQMLRRLLVPLFAFVIIRTHEKMGGPERWTRSIVVAGIIGYFSTDIDELTRKKVRAGKRALPGALEGRKGRS